MKTVKECYHKDNGDSIQFYMNGVYIGSRSCLKLCQQILAERTEKDDAQKEQ